jgi:SAM-dependent methyltransferase
LAQFRRSLPHYSAVTPVSLALGDAPIVGSEQIDEAVALLSACAWPSEAYWRLLELAAVRPHLLDAASPVLELGCGDGLFTALTGLQVDLAVDREPRAVQRAGDRQSVYRAVRQTDIRNLDASLGPFGTIFSNSVLEHVPDIDSVLERACELLVPGGRLIATVPLREMNGHLAVRGSAYARMRQSQLQHRNLWSIEEWRARLGAAGFATVKTDSYLDAAACRRWDRLDAGGALGAGRYRVAPAIHRLAGVTLSASLSRRVKAWIAPVLLGWTLRPVEEPFCAAVLVATKPA